MTTPTTTSKKGLILSLLVALVLFAVIGVKLIWIQIIEGPELADQGRQMRTYTQLLPAQRGSIVDATGTVLAQSSETYHIAVNQEKVAHAVVYAKEGNSVVQTGVGPHAVAEQLAPILEMNPVELGGMLVGDEHYKYLKKDVPPNVWRQVRKLGLYGIEWEPSFKRNYPNGAVAATVIGNVNAEGTGASGLEASQNELLTGADGKESFEVDGNGVVMPGGDQVIDERRDGSTIHTTLRLDLQYAAEDALNRAVSKFGAEWGVVAVQEIATGNLLVLADSGNRPIDDRPQVERGAQFAVEPGSVGKILTAASALEAKQVTPTTVFDVPYEYTAPNGQKFRDSSQHPGMKRTVTGILARSSNTGTVQIGDSVDDQTRYDLMRNLGLGEATGIELPGEAAGLLQSPDQWDGRQRYTTMFGQGYAVSTVQQVAMMAAFGNGGVYLPPRIIDGWSNPDGTYESAPRPQPRQALSPEVANMVVRMLESTVTDEEGTGQGVAVPGYRISVKTGTAELIKDGQYIGFAGHISGVLPSDHPAIAITVSLYRPQSGQFGAVVAGPAFKEVAEAAIRSLGIPPSKEPADLYPTKPE